MEELTRENAELKYKLDNIDSENARELREKKKELDQLKVAHAALEKEQQSQVEELKEARALKADLDAQLKTREQEMQIRWWNGGRTGLSLPAPVPLSVLFWYTCPVREESVTIIINRGTDGTPCKAVPSSPSQPMPGSSRLGFLFGCS